MSKVVKEKNREIGHKEREETVESKGNCQKEVEEKYMEMRGRTR